MNNSVKKNVNFIDSSENEGLSRDLMHSYNPSMDLAQLHRTVFGFFIRPSKDRTYYVMALSVRGHFSFPDFFLLSLQL